MASIINKNGLQFKMAKGTYYCLEPICADTETSNNHADDPKDLITWISSIQVLFNGNYYLFRYPEELVDFYRKLDRKYKLKPGKFRYNVVTYFHNLSFDMAALLPYLRQLPDYGNEYQGIIEGPNKFLTYVRGPFEFRCSYRLSGMSLEKWGKEMTIEHPKAVGLYDYDKIIYQDDELDENSQIYDRLDVISLKECLDKQFAFHKDDISTTVLTSTGYIRRTLRSSCRKQKFYRNDYFSKTRLNSDNYIFALRSYSGGYTHMNRWYSSMLLKCNTTVEYMPFTGDYVKIEKIKHRDFKSHYPSQMTCRDFPIGRPQLVYYDDIPTNYSMEKIFKYMDENYYLVKIRFTHAELRDPAISMPFMQYAKMYQCKTNFKILDNGRVLEWDGDCIMYLDSYTLRILYEQYHMTYHICEVWAMKLGPLPDCIVKVVDKYFKGKSDKKALVHELTKQFGKLDPQTVDAEFLLSQDKKGLNSCYGCMCMNPLRDQMAIDDDFVFFYKTLYVKEETIKEGLDTYYNNRNSFLPYQIGCAVTSLARYELAEFIGVFPGKGIGYKYVIYSDTDSLFYISNEQTEAAVEALNAEKRKTAHSVVLDNGKIEFYDEFTEEPDCLAFKGLHSKCYGVVTDKGLEITIAGVPARTITGLDENGKPKYFTREEELANGEKCPYKALDHLTDDFTFHINTGVCALYVGATGYNTPRVPTILNIDGHEIHTAGGCVIKKLESKAIHDLTQPKTSSDNYEELISIDSLI